MCCSHLCSKFSIVFKLRASFSFSVNGIQVVFFLNVLLTHVYYSNYFNIVLADWENTISHLFRLTIANAYAVIESKKKKHPQERTEQKSFSRNTQQFFCWIMTAQITCRCCWLWCAWQENSFLFLPYSLLMYAQSLSCTNKLCKRQVRSGFSIIVCKLVEINYRGRL